MSISSRVAVFTSATIASVVLSSISCESAPTVGEVKWKNRDLGAALAAGVDAARKLVTEAPNPAPDAVCSQAGLTLNSYYGYRGEPKAGNAEMVHLISLWSAEENRLKPPRIDPLREALGTGAGPAVVLAHHHRAVAASDWKRESYLKQKVTPQELADYDRARDVHHLIILRTDPSFSDHADVFLVEFPSVKLVCGFRVGVAERMASGYNPYTGDPWVAADAAVTTRQLVEHDPRRSPWPEHPAPPERANRAPAASQVHKRLVFFALFVHNQRTGPLAARGDPELLAAGLCFTRKESPMSKNAFCG